MPLYFGYISMFSILPAAFLAAWYWKAWIFTNVKVLALIVLFRAISEAVNYILYHYSKNSLQIFSAIYNMIDLGLIILMYLSIPKYKKYYKVYILLWITCLIVFSVELFKSNIIYPNMGKSATALAIISITIYQFYKQLQFGLPKLYELYASVAFLSFNLITLVTFANANRLHNSGYDAVFITVYMCSVFANGLLFLALLNFKKWIQQM